MFEIGFGVRMVRAEKIRPCSSDCRAGAIAAGATQTPLLSVERIASPANDTPMELRRGLYLTGHPPLPQRIEALLFAQRRAKSHAIKFWAAAL